MASKLLLITVFVFDLIAFGLAVAAEQRRSTVSFLISIHSFFSLNPKQKSGFENNHVINKPLLDKRSFLFFSILIVDEMRKCGQSLNL